MSLNEDRAALLVGDCRERLKELPENSIDAVVTDPPYELGFMNKGWDSSDVAFAKETWAEVLRVLKPGGHLLAFSGTRTYHFMAVAIARAGFEIRDMLSWVYLNGFPKSMDVSKAIDKSAGHWRGRAGAVLSGNVAMSAANYERTPKGDPVTAAAATWEGWGTALKPAHEPFCMARKPLVGTVAGNVLEHGTGALNIGGCRIEAPDKTPAPQGQYGGSRIGPERHRGVRDGSADHLGRWPANLILGEGVGERLAPYFYCPKASRAEREEGCGGLPIKASHEELGREEGSAGLESPRAGAGRTRMGIRNVHPTVKPIALMRYLCRLVTPPGGVVLDPFTGSGSTGVAALREGFSFLGVEMSEEYAAIAEARIRNALKLGAFK